MAPKLRGTGLRLAAAQIAATGGASVFAFLSVAAVQGILINVTSPKFFRRISPWIQMVGMSAMVLTFCSGFPVLRGTLEARRSSKSNSGCILFPPVWFSGMYELFLGGPNQFLASLGMLAIKMTGTDALVIVLVTWGFGFRRHFRRTLETEDAPHRPRDWWTHVRIGWFGLPQERRSHSDSSAKRWHAARSTNSSSRRTSAPGCPIACSSAVAIRDGKIALSPGGARAVAVRSRVLCHLRFPCGVPVSRRALLQLDLSHDRSRWTEVSRSATRKLVLAIGLVPLLILALPMEVAEWTLADRSGTLVRAADRRGVDY